MLRFKLRTMRAFTTHPYFVANPLQGAALARLRQAATFPGGLVVLSGGPGVGKSALLRHALAPVAGELDVVAMDLRGADPAEFPDCLIDALGTLPDATALPMPARLRAALAARRSANRLLVVALDVPGINVDLARRLLRLVNLCDEQQAPVSLVIQGPHTLHPLFDVPGLIQLRQRLGYRHRLRPLTLLETAGYVRHGLEAAGANPDDVMAVNGPAAVYLYVAGVPRLVNTLMDAALSELQARQGGKLDAELVRQVAEQLGWKPLGTRGAAEPPRKPVPPPSRRQGDRPGGRALADVPPPPPPAEPLPASEMTRRLQVAAPPATAKAAEAPAPPAERRAPVAPEPAPPVPMDEADTGATGMLKLEELDERFAETLFSEDSGHFKALIDGKGD